MRKNRQETKNKSKKREKKILRIGKDEVTEEMIKSVMNDWQSGLEIVVMAFKSDLVQEDWRSLVSVAGQKRLQEEQQYQFTKYCCKNLCIRTERLTVDEEGSFTSGRGCVDQILNLKRLS